MSWVRTNSAKTPNKPVTAFASAAAMQAFVTTSGFTGNALWDITNSKWVTGDFPIRITGRTTSEFYATVGCSVLFDGVRKEFVAGAWADSSTAQSDKLIGSISQSLLTGAPLQVTADNVVATLGPTAQGVAVAEYNALKTNRLEWKYFSGSTLINQDKLGAAGTAWVDNPHSLGARTLSAPWPQTNGTTGWWAKDTTSWWWMEKESLPSLIS